MSIEILKELFESVDKHPETVSFLEDVDGVKWLPVDNIVNGHIKADREYTALTSALAFTIHGLFITSSGQCSQAFYDIQKEGFKTKVEEADSFGPLACSVTPPHGNYSVAYG